MDGTIGRSRARTCQHLLPLAGQGWATAERRHFSVPTWMELMPKLGGLGASSRIPQHAKSSQQRDGFLMMRPKLQCVPQAKSEGVFFLSLRIKKREINAETSALTTLSDVFVPDYTQMPPYLLTLGPARAVS